MKLEIKEIILIDLICFVWLLLYESVIFLRVMCDLHDDFESQQEWTFSWIEVPQQHSCRITPVVATTKMLSNK